MLGAVAWLAPGPDDAGVMRTLLPRAPDPPAAIVVERAGLPALEFERTGDHWFLRTPGRVPAHPRRMADLLAVPALPVVTTLDVERGAWPAFGLSPPAVTLHLDGQVLAFGTTDALDGRRYVLQDGQVHLVAERVFAQMLQGPEFFVDPRLLREGLQPMRIATPLRRITRSGAGWIDEDAGGAPAAADLARAWLEAEATAVRFSADPAADHGTVTIGLADGATIVFALVRINGQDGLERRDLGLRYLLDTSELPALALAAAADPRAAAGSGN